MKIGGFIPGIIKLREIFCKDRKKKTDSYL